MVRAARIEVFWDVDCHTSPLEVVIALVLVLVG